MQQHVLVLQRDPVVAADISEIALGLMPQATVHLTETVADACSVLARTPGWIWAVLDGSSEELTLPDLRDALSHHGTLTVALGAPFGGADYADWVFLDPPFTTEGLTGALRGFGRS